MHRRDFLKFQAAAALSIGAAALGFPARLLADASPDIAVVKGSPAAATRAAVELLGGMSAFVRPGQKVVIKPNMSFKPVREQSVSLTTPSRAERSRLSGRASLTPATA